MCLLAIHVGPTFLDHILNTVDIYKENRPYSLIVRTSYFIFVCTRLITCVLFVV